jgi:hypothetical protein
VEMVVWLLMDPIMSLVTSMMRSVMTVNNVRQMMELVRSVLLIVNVHDYETKYVNHVVEMDVV